MKDQLISFETAKLAKKAGFDERCVKVYNTLGELWDCHYAYMTNSDPDSGACCTAPTQSLLQKWIREKHNAHIQICTYEDTTFPNKYFFKIYDMDYGLGRVVGLLLSSELKYEKYEDALEAGLKECCICLINNFDE